MTHQESKETPEEWEAFCNDAFRRWDEALDVPTLQMLCEFVDGRTVAEILGLIGVLAVNAINNASNKEDHACDYARALGKYIHERCHSSFTQMKTNAAMIEKLESRLKEQ